MSYEAIALVNKFIRTFKATIIDVWEREYKNINENRQKKLKRLEELRPEKTSLIDMKKCDLLPDDDFTEAFNRVKRDIEINEADVCENVFEEFNIDEAVDYVFGFIKSLPEYWQRTTFEQQIKLQS